MRILLVDADSTIPNLALMKLSTYYKRQLNKVEFRRLEISYYPNRKRQAVVDTEGYDRVFMSVVFENTIPFITFTGAAPVTIGGTGFDLQIVLPSEVEACALDYSLYPDNDTAYGFITRGCNRTCYFCKVPQKEGKLRQVETDLNVIIGDFKKVKFMDNNFLQLPNHLEILQELVARKVRCQFNQGLDFRLLTPENSDLLRKLNYEQQYLFAFDSYKYRRELERRVVLLDWMPDWKAKFYVYVEPEMPLSDTILRIEWLKQRKFLPYLMRSLSCWGSEYEHFYTDLAGWCNQPGIFKKMTFHEYCDKRAISTERKVESAALWDLANKNSEESP